MTIVGTVATLNRFPVKSMAGERPDAVDLRWHGIAGDRQYSLYRTDDRTRFPWLSARDHSRLVLYRAAFREPSDPKRSPVDVITPEGATHELFAPALLAHLRKETGEELRLLQMGRGLHDAMPVSVATTSTHAAIDAAHGAAVDPARFRTNIVIDSDEGENAWCGKRLAIGEDGAQLLCSHPIPRCALITIHPTTAVRDPSILRTVAQRFGNMIGAYCPVAAQGTIRVGDAVRLIQEV